MTGHEADVDASAMDGGTLTLRSWSEELSVLRQLVRHEVVLNA